MSNGFASQLAWVTGAASGIGRAVASRLSAEGVRILALDVDCNGLAALKQILGCETFACDLSDIGSVESILDGVPASYRQPDIAVHAAGIYRSAPLGDHGVSLWREVISVNLDGAFHFTRLVLPLMMANSYGRLILVSSGSAIKVSPGVAAYSSSKAGVIALAKAAALEGAGAGVTVNVVAPGLVDTPMTRNALGGAEGLQAVATASDIANPMKLVMVPEDIAHAVAFLADPRSRAITGQVVHVNAGNLMP